MHYSISWDICHSKMLKVSESITPWFLLFFCRCGVINLHLVLLLKLLFFLFFLFPCSLGLDRLKLSCLPFTKCVISYSIVDLDPWRNINCTYESFCYARDEWTYECRCRSNCPSYEEHVCGSNGRTFRNMCDFKQTICEERGNYTNYHPGRCNGIKYCVFVY